MIRFLPALMLLWAFSVPAHEGHDHGAEPQPAVGSVAPRFEARSPSFELVGVLQGAELVLYLDRATDNAPIAGATIELAAGSHQARATAAADGSYRLAAGPLAQPGRHALTLTVETAADADLLAATFEHAPPPAPVAAAPAASTPVLPWLAGAALLLLAFVLLGQWRRR